MAKKEISSSKEEKIQSSLSFFLKDNEKKVKIAVIIAFVVVVAIVIIVSAGKSGKAGNMVSYADCEKVASSVDFSSKDAVDSLVVDLNKLSKGKSDVAVRSTYLKGLVYFRADSYSDAFDTFKECVKKDKKHYLAPLALINAAVSCEKLNNAEEALSFYKKAYEEYPNENPVLAKAMFNAGRILISLGNETEGNEIFAKLLEVNPESEYAKLVVSYNSLAK